MSKPGRGRLTRRTAIAGAAALAAVVTGGGYALASTNSSGQAPSTNGVSLRYLVGSNVIAAAHSTASNATECPAGMYPVGGGPSSSHAVWEIQWSDADRSTPAVAHPNEWTVSLYNNSNSAAAFKVFVVCSTASSVSGNY
jgi:hypothetical protein